MTAEIAILNRSAVALAADSALTVGYGDEQKTYHTHKLFMLSQSEPVGIMIFNSANLLGMPWETIIKHYRKKEGNRTFDHLGDYAEHLLSYLNDNAFFFPQDVQDNNAVRNILSCLMFLSDRIDESIEEMAHPAGKVKLADIEDITKIWIETSYEALDKQPLSSIYPSGHRRKVYARYVSSIEILIDEVFQTLPLTPALRKKLRRICLDILLKSSIINGDDYTGIVVAGFGEQDLYPALAAYKISSVVLGKLRYVTMEKESINFGDDAFVYAFAQSDVVRGFMDGITSDLKDEVRKSMDIQLKHFGENILKVLPKMTLKKKKAALDEIERIRKEILKTFSSNLEAHCKETYSNPIVDTVALLPKEELASMAETLVSLTSFKRRVTLDAETVGGPIDVAVITKGDGLIWIKRKHYFEAQLNPQFFKNRL